MQQNANNENEDEANKKVTTKAKNTKIKEIKNFNTRLSQIKNAL